MKNATKNTQAAEFPGVRFGELAYMSNKVKTIVVNGPLTTPDLDPQGGVLLILQPAAANQVVSGMLAPKSEWRRRTIVNDSAFHLTFTDEDAASVAANRFKLGGVAFVLQAGRAADFIYDQTAATKRWRVLANEATFAS